MCCSEQSPHGHNFVTLTTARDELTISRVKEIRNRTLTAIL